MGYKVGIGLLLPLPANNSILELELVIADKTGNYSGYRQPPHITVKRPFVVKNLEDIAALFEVLQETNFEKIEALRFEAINEFNNGTLYAKVATSQSLIDIHRMLLGVCSQFESSMALYEGDEMAFHTSLLFGSLSENKELIISELEKKLSKIEMFTPEALAVFLHIEDTDSWVVIRTIPLKS